MELEVNYDTAKSIAEGLRGNGESNLEISQITLKFLNQVKNVLEKEDPWDRDIINVVDDAIKIKENSQQFNSNFGMNN